jgi:hypothetical protein
MRAVWYTSCRRQSRSERNSLPHIVRTIIRPETLVRWHRAGFRRYWRWEARTLCARSSASALSLHMRSLADYTIDTHESSFMGWPAPSQRDR